MIQISTENKAKTNRKKMMIFLISSLLMTVFLMKNQVYALSNNLDQASDALKKIYDNYGELFKQNNVADNILRTIGMGLLKFIVMIADAASGLFDKSFGMIDFTNYSAVQDYINEYKVVWVALLSVSMAWLGVNLVFNADKKPKIVTNLCVGILVVTSMTWMVSQMNTLLSKQVRSEILGTVSQETVYDILGNNVHDLLYIDSIAGLENIGEKNADGTKYANVKTPITKKSWKSMDINEVVKPDDVKDESKIIMQYYKTDLYDENGNEKTILNECYDGVAWTDLLNTYYYRYSVDWVSAILQILAITIIFIFFTYKVVRTFFEVVFQEILAMLYSPNITNGQKTLKILDGIKNSYIMIILALVSVKLYLLVTTFISAKTWDGFTKAIMLFFVALAVIDGPNIVQKLTGEDVGISDGLSKMMSVMYGTNMATNMGRAVYGAARGAVSKTAGLGKKAAQTAFGKDASAEKAFGATAATAAMGAGNSNLNENNDNNQNDMSQDVGAQFNNADENNSTEENNNENSDRNSNLENNNSENNGESKQAASDSLSENVNADGRTGDMDDNAVADSNHEKMIADTLNGMDPLGNNSGDISSTKKMDDELDAKDSGINFSNNKRGTLNTSSGFEKYMSSGDYQVKSSNINNTQKMTQFGKGQTSVKESYGVTEKVSNVNRKSEANEIKKQVFRETGKDSDD